jgi:hypothetical protein
MVVPSTANGFRAAVCQIPSFDGKEGVSFHNSFPENRYVRLLLEKLRKGMPDNDVREELKSLNIRVQEVLLLQSSRSDQHHPPNTHFSVSVARRPEVSKVPSLTEF